jgi:hypothetical protein
MMVFYGQTGGKGFARMRRHRNDEAIGQRNSAEQDHQSQAQAEYSFHDGSPFK